jgi:hypothetical protein
MPEELRPELTPMPLRMKALPLYRGYPVPWFVNWIDGAPDFRVADGRKFKRAIQDKRCWVCGDPLGRFQSFVIGPMCAVSRTTSEPPCHHECARWSAMSCPFLARPHMRRRLNDLPPADFAHAAGLPIDRNPGVACVWTTLGYQTFRAHAGTAGVLITIGAPVEVEWFAEGRAATRAEIQTSIDSGLPALLQTIDLEQPAMQARAREELHAARLAVEALWPAW